MAQARQHSDPDEKTLAMAKKHPEVFEAAIEAGRSAGRKAAKKKLKRAAKHGGIKLSNALRSATLRDAEKAGGRAAYSAATKALRKASARMPVPAAPAPVPPTHTLPPTDFSGFLGEATPPSRPRASGSQVVLEVLRTAWLSRSMVRIVAGGAGFADFESNGAADQHVKLHFANPALGLAPPYEMRSLRALLAREDLPVSRSYTIRRHDSVAREISIDFFVHQINGVASAWAAGAKPGDLMVLSKPKGNFRPDASAEQHLYIGDESAIPAISSALDMLPSNAMGKVFLEVDGEEDHQEIEVPPQMRLSWIHRGAEPSATSAVLANSLRELPAAHGQVEILALGERSATQDIRRLLTHWDLDQRRIKVSSYWRAGRIKHAWRQLPASASESTFG